MYIITNRKERNNKFSNEINTDPGELSFAEANQLDKSFELNIFDRQENFEGRIMPDSEAMFLKVQKRMDDNSSNCLIFCHGFNNDFRSALKAASKIQDAYSNLEVVLFTWASKGQIFNYYDDKPIAQESAESLGYFLEKLNEYSQKYRGRNGLCRQKITLAMHSMGAYILESLVDTASFQNNIVFDNVILLAPDVNNENHRDWIEKIEVRNKLFITINENDTALNISEMKPGEEQKSRLGNTITDLNANNATYLDFSDADRVGDDHNYFSDKVQLKNPLIKQTFNKAFNGEDAVEGLDRIRNNVYKVPST